MKKSTWSAALTFTAVGALLIACGASKKSSDSPQVEGCPETVEEVSRLSWKVKDPEGSQIKSGLMAALAIDSLAGKMGEELRDACGDLARQLFVKGGELEPEEYYVGAEAELACNKADESLSKLKEIAGGELKIEAGVVLCSAPVNAAEECLATCVAAQEPEKGAEPVSVEVSCGGELSGKCEGTCSGQCTIEDTGECAGSCGGQCNGACDSDFTGMCRQKCEGKCDGVDSTGECQGTCEGRCMEGARGTCGGTCMGSCDGACTMEAGGECTGICAGECDGNVTEQRCTGPLTLPEGTEGCAALCDSMVLGKTSCTPPTVKVSVTDPGNEEAAGLLQRALGQHLPKILAARALNIEQARVATVAKLSDEAMAGMVSTAKSVEKDLGSNLACVEDIAKIEATSSKGLPVIFLAGNTAQTLSH